MAKTPVIPMGWGGGVVSFGVSQGPLSLGLVWTHINHTYSQVTWPPLRGQIFVSMFVSLFVLCNWEDSQVKCFCCVTGHNPGERSVSHDWADAQVKCLCCTTGQISRLRTSRATGESSNMTIRSGTLHIRSSHMAVRSLGQMSVSCSWAAQQPGTHIRTKRTTTVRGVLCSR